MNDQRFNSLWTDGILQVRDEMKWIVEKLEQVHPHTVVEIGVWHGGTMKYWDDVVDNGLLIGVDMDPHFEESIKKIREYSNNRLEFIYGNSYAPSTREKAVEILNGREVDFLFIDGDHSMAGVSGDFETYSPLVREGGLVGFHDLSCSNDVWNFFGRLRRGRKEAYISSKDHGMGVWYKPYLKDLFE